MNKLQKYISENKNAVALIVKKTGICSASIYNWSRGISQPGVVNAIKLERATRGSVSVYSWK